MKIYVAGHTGLLGSALVRGLKAQGYNDIFGYASEDVDLTQDVPIWRLLSQNRIDYCFMAAGVVGGIQANIDDPRRFLGDNTRIALNVIDCCADLNIPLCYIGSSCMYPANNPQPMQEDDLLTGALEPTNEGYALAKLVGMKYAQIACPESVVAIPCNLYGEGDHYDPRTSHLMPALIKRFVDAQESGLMSVTLWGTGTPRREFLHVDDCAQALIKLMQHGAKGVYNIGSGTDYPIGYLATIVARVVGYAGQILWDTDKPDGMMRKKLDTSRISDLGWYPQTPLRQGIERTIEDYKNRVKTAI